jgi:outer membrane lipoprotein-sorting protein
MRNIRHREKPKATWRSSFRIWIASLMLAMTTIFPAHAEESITFFSDAQLAKNKTTIERVEKYLSGLTTVVSDFNQVAPDGSLANGKFFMQRPGKMRWQYNPPTPVLMVSDGDNLVYYDYELEQVNNIPLDSTLIGFLAQDPIRFDNKVGIFSLETIPGVIRIGVAPRDKPSEGQLVLELSDKPLQLRNFIVTDASGQVTTVALNNAKFGMPLDKKLFDFRDPRKSWRHSPLNRNVDVNTLGQ